MVSLHITLIDLVYEVRSRVLFLRLCIQISHLSVNILLDTAYYKMKGMWDGREKEKKERLPQIKYHHS